MSLVPALQHSLPVTKSFIWRIFCTIPKVPTRSIMWWMQPSSIAGLVGDLDLLLDLNLTLHGILVRPEQTRLAALDTLISAGVLRPIIDLVLPLEKAAQAHRRLETGHGQGKIVLAVRKEAD